MRRLFHLITLAAVCLPVRADESVKTSARVFAKVEQMNGSTAPDRQLLAETASAAEIHLVPCLRKAKTLEVFSLLPDEYKAMPKEVRRFHGYPILTCWLFRSSCCNLNFAIFNFQSSSPAQSNPPPDRPRTALHRVRQL